MGRVSALWMHNKIVCNFSFDTMPKFEGRQWWFLKSSVRLKISEMDSRCKTMSFGTGLLVCCRGLKGLSRKHDYLSRLNTLKCKQFLDSNLQKSRWKQKVKILVSGWHETNMAACRTENGTFSITIPLQDWKVRNWEISKIQNCRKRDLKRNFQNSNLQKISIDVYYITKDKVCNKKAEI